MTTDRDVTQEIEFTPEEQFNHYLPLFQEHIKGKDIDDLADKMGISRTTCYSYIGGKVPDRANCKYIVELGIEILIAKGVHIEQI